MNESSHDDSSDRSLNDEISVVNNLLSDVTLTSLCAPPLPTLPFDIVEEIFYRLPVKLLLQLRCVCKRWNSLISDPKFAKNHLSHSTTRRIHFLSCSTSRIRSCITQSYKNILTSYPLDSLFTNEVTADVTQLEYPPDNFDGDFPPEFYYYIVGSCNGILCIADFNEGFVLMCNPSLGKSKQLPHLQKPQTLNQVEISYGFGYDHVNDNYKVVAILNYNVRESSGNMVCKTEVKVHTLGTSFWKNLPEFHFFCGVPAELSGKFVSGTIYWLLCKDGNVRRNRSYFIVSFDLENESFQEVLKPDYGNVEKSFVILSVLRDCLCLIYDHDIWLMKEYRNKESWTKLFTVSYMRESYALDKAIYVFEDDQVLLESRWDNLDMKLIVYDSKINTFKFTKFQNESVYNSYYNGPEVSVESLIFPWS